MAAISRERFEIGKGDEIRREDIQAAVAKAVELRAIHAALMQGNRNSPSLNLRLPFPSASPVSSAHDYPVFNPTYEDEPLPGYHQLTLENRKYAESSGDYDETAFSDYRTVSTSLAKEVSSELNLEVHKCPAEDQDSVAGLNRGASPGHDYSKSRRNSVGDVKSMASYNKCKPTVSSNYDLDGLAKNSREANMIVPVKNVQSSLHSQARSKGMSFSWLFPKLKKKSKENSPSGMQPEDVSQVLKDLGMLSTETLKKELIEAQESRDAALIEVAEMKSSLGELSQKLEYLETYCEELKKALRQAVQAKISQPGEKLTNLPKRGKSVDGNGENSMLNDEAMVDVFVRLVSESRISVKQFCKILIGQVQETDHILLDNLNALLQPYRLSLNSKHSKAVFYHLEAVINRSLYRDFENCVFQKNGTPNLLDPHQECRAKFQLFATMRNLSWNEVLRKGTKFYSNEFSKFCDQKMSGILAALGWTRPWPEQLLQAFFVAGKCIWLLHLLAFSFDPPLGILRVDENRAFEPHYMDDIYADKQRPQAPSRVKVMVMPGFYVQDKVLRCKVLCRYKSVV